MLRAHSTAVGAKRTISLWALAAAAIVAASTPSRPAAAKSERVTDYRYPAVWSTAIRLLRVDRRYRITDKDRDNGFVLFTYPGGGRVKKCPASLELIPIVDDRGYRRLRLQVKIAHQPSYVEAHLIDGLLQKLAEERGDPPPPERPARKPGGKDKGKGKGGKKDRDDKADDKPPRR